MSAHLAAADYSYVPPGRHHLFVPGPTNINVRVERAMMRPSENHRDPHFPFVAKQCLEDLKVRERRPESARRLCDIGSRFCALPFSPLLQYLFKTKEGRPFIFPCADAACLVPPASCPRLFAQEVGHPQKSDSESPFAATGTGAWESGLSNTLSPGDKVVCFRYGQFSHLWIDMAQRLGLNVEVLEEARCQNSPRAERSRVGSPKIRRMDRD